MGIHRLAGMRVYLAGAMDRAADGGVGWRKEITPILNQKGVIVLDPSDKPLEEAREDALERPGRTLWKEEGNYSTLAKHVKPIRHVDLRMVDEASFLIVHIDLDVYACGTMEELFWANRMKKPILVWVEQGKERCPDWLFATIPHQMIFGDRQSLLNYLDGIDSAEEVESLGRWIFFQMEKMYNGEVLERLNELYFDALTV